MLRILWNGRSSMVAQQDKLDCISNNIANVKTVGYKKEDVTFKDLMYEKLDRRGYPTNPGQNKNLISGTGVTTGRWTRNTEKQGDLVNTGVNTDLAIDGRGFFRVIDSRGQYKYERNGSFNIDNNGDIVDKIGNKLDVQFYGDKPRFTQDNFRIRKDGTLSVEERVNGVTTSREAGKINVYDAIGDEAFISVGENLYEPLDGVNPVTYEDSEVLSGYLENSNVQIEKEMTDMIMTQRAFEFGSRAVRTADEMWGMANNIKSR